MAVVTARKSLGKIKDATEFYPHQIDGVRHLARINSFILADDMGLGKTLEALTVAAIDFERGWANRILFVTLASLKWNPVTDIEDFTNFTWMVLDGTPAKREQQLEAFEESDLDILIVNYEQIKVHWEQLNQMRFQIVILDEAHAVKNHKSHRTKAVHKLRADRFFELTGSPLLNQVDDLWSLLHIVDPAGFPSYWRFVNRYAVFGGFKDKQIVGIKNETELIEILNKYMLRRLKKDVLDLPEKQYLSIKVDLHPEQRKLYTQATDELRIELPDDPTPMEIENALTKFLRLKQICGTTATIPGYEDFSIKLDVAVDKIIEICWQAREPVVVFTQFRAVQACLVKRLEHTEIPVFQLHGDVPKRDRVDVVHDWESKDNAALIAMIQVAGVGLNMTAANKCIFVDKLFVPKLNEQGEDRLHRIGADITQPVQIIELIARNTIEQRVETILKRKRKLFTTLVENDSEWKRQLYKSLEEEEVA